MEDQTKAIKEKTYFEEDGNIGDEICINIILKIRSLKMNMNMTM